MAGVAGRGALAGCVLACLLGTSGTAEARVGDLAPEWGGGQPVFIPPEESDNYARMGAVTAQRDGKLVVAGTSGLANPRCAGCEQPVTWIIERFLPDGRLDPDFGSGGIVKLEMEPMTFVSAIVVRPSDQRILIGGSSGWSEELGAAFVSLTPEGSPDSSFAGRGRVYLSRSGTFVRGSGTMALDESGNAYMAGWGENLDPCCRHQGVIASVTPSGAPNGWAPGGILIPDVGAADSENVELTSVAVSGEKLFYAGSVTPEGMASQALLGAVRRSNGRPLASFGSRGVFRLEAPTGFSDLLVGSGGKLNATGGATASGPFAGTLIASFDTGGADPTDRGFGRGGRVIVGGAEVNSPNGGRAITEQGRRLFVASSVLERESTGYVVRPALVGVDAATGAVDTRLGAQGFRVLDFGAEPQMLALAAMQRSVVLAGSDRERGVLAVVETVPRAGEVRARTGRSRLRDGRVRVRVTGRVLLPSGVTESEGCRGAITARFIRSGRVVRRDRTRLSPRCRFSFGETFGPQRAPARVALRFLGNAFVGPAGLRKKL